MRELAEGIRLLGPDDYRRMRWKNGGGWTTEIAVCPEDAGLNGKPFDWRVSMAEVETDGDFSAFPGYDRTILLAEGAGMELSFDAAPSQDISRPYEPVSFSGEWRTHCRLLNGPVRDFNVMTARSQWQHTCKMLHGASFVFAGKPGVQSALVYCFRGQAEISWAENHRRELKAAGTLWCYGESTVNHLRIVPDAADTVLALVSFICKP